MGPMMGVYITLLALRWTLQQVLLYNPTHLIMGLWLTDVISIDLASIKAGQWTFYLPCEYIKCLICYRALVYCKKESNHLAAFLQKRSRYSRLKHCCNGVRFCKRFLFVLGKWVNPFRVIVTDLSLCQCKHLKFCCFCYVCTFVLYCTFGNRSDTSLSEGFPSGLSKPSD